MAKLVTITIDPETATSTIDLTGFHGKGCADVLKAFEGLGKRTKEITKPEHNQNKLNTVTK